uniref:RRM domain-containing protein n=1 Tax=Hemiselmis andersenii TaxID=464988 RepID=A0A7S1DHL0_HEMAN|mmetsp:Transcript_150/g.412  ORF Transcript_150/g.412 Transcript_150/m.412 type:complete len:153 (+) Transcript_150:2-460(+)
MRGGPSEGSFHQFSRGMESARSPESMPNPFVQESAFGRFTSRDDDASSRAGSTTGGTLQLDRLSCIVTITDFASDSDETRATLGRALQQFGNLRQALRMVKGRTGRFNAVVEMQTPEQAARVVAGLDNATYNGDSLRAIVALPFGDNRHQEA